MNSSCPVKNDNSYTRGIIVNITPGIINVDTYIGKGYSGNLLDVIEYSLAGPSARAI
jgi:hypothetical protein